MLIQSTNEIGGISPLFSKVMLLNAKIMNGGYTFDEVKCFCGEDNSVEVCNRDRYGIFYSIHLCKNCGLLFAKKQMDKKSSKIFYENEYRDIYDTDVDKKIEFIQGSENSKQLKELLEDTEVNPNIIFEIGCNNGSMLSAFKDKETHGVDYDIDAVKYGKSKGLNVDYGGVDELIKLNKKADLVIMHHVLEHFNDLEKELKTISGLLSKDGVLFVGIPSLHGSNLDTLFQNAHNWQFTVNTLDYVMACCGYEALYLDSTISSLWIYTGKKRDKKAFYHKEAKDIWGSAFSGKNLLPYISTHCKFPLKDRRSNISKTLSYRFPDIRKLQNIEHGNEAVIISGGPSIKNYIDKIKEFKLSGMKIISIDRMYSWCLDNNIEPDYVLVIDGHDNVVESFKQINKNTKHLIASMCKPSLCEMLKNYKTYIFSCEQAGINNLGTLWDENGYEKVSLHNVGGSVALGCMPISLYLGMKKLHYFGFDCHIGNGDYAKGISDNGELGGELILTVDSKDWTTTNSLASFAQQFFELYAMAKNEKMIDSVRIYGDSLVKAMSKINIDGDKKGK